MKKQTHLTNLAILTQITMVLARKTNQRDQIQAHGAFCAVVHGTTIQTPCAAPTATTTDRRIRSAASVFAVRRNSSPLALLPFYPLGMGDLG
jgi:hypothetical protein